MIQVCDNRESMFMFGSLSQGDVFEYNGTYAIKIDEVTRGSKYYNAVDLQSGDLRYFDRYTEISQCKKVKLDIIE